MTKKEFSELTEKLVEKIAAKYGAKIETKTITVGGRKTPSKVAVGGFFDLDGARRIAAMAIAKLQDEIVNFELGGGVVAAAYALNKEEEVA